MEKIKKPCPRCNSLQVFPRKEKTIGAEVEIYIECNKCHWKKVFEKGNAEIIKLKQDIAELKNSNISGIDRVIQKKKEKIERLDKKAS